ncbi:MAG TPA: YciI family protein [Gemmatimonadaceae bacterium]|nr:YciI family protein [Gemmatimonadaceae bacterium]
MRYMMFIKHTEDYRGKTIPPALMEAMGEFVGENMKKGRIVDTNGLKSSHEGKKVQLRGGQLRIIDGPFTESKELVGGYAIVELESDQEALDLATQFMDLHRIHWPEFEGECELRPVETGEPGSE